MRKWLFGISMLLIAAALLITPLADGIFHKHGEREAAKYISSWKNYFRTEDSLRYAAYQAACKRGGEGAGILILGLHYNRSEDWMLIYAAAENIKAAAQRECLIGGYWNVVESNPLWMMLWMIFIFGTGLTGMSVLIPAREDVASEPSHPQKGERRLPSLTTYIVQAR